MLYIRWIHTHHIKSIMLGVQHPMHVISTSNYQYWTKAAIVNCKLPTVTQLHLYKYSLMQWNTDTCVHFFFMRYLLNLTFHSMSLANALLTKPQYYI
jgi:hypothetical protein